MSTPVKALIKERLQAKLDFNGPSPDCMCETAEANDFDVNFRKRKLYHEPQWSGLGTRFQYIPSVLECSHGYIQTHNGFENGTRQKCPPSPLNMAVVHGSQRYSQQIVSPKSLSDAQVLYRSNMCVLSEVILNRLFFRRLLKNDGVAEENLHVLLPLNIG